jgi:putative oxidoreductase
MAIVSQSADYSSRSLYALLVTAGSALADWLVPLLQRLAIAATFFLSGRTKVEGVFSITDGTFALFETEYRLPFLAADATAYIATTAEHIFPILLVLGLFTRFSALALLAMTLVIQTFVYPDAWPTHLAWAALLIPLLFWGGGAVSLDRLLGIARERR